VVSARARTRRLGQNFLVDRNILDVIERLAELDADDVVLEIGGGLGVLSQRLAARVKHLHVIEVDARLEPKLRNALDDFDNTSVHIADVLQVDLPSLRPGPTRIVANLPYSVAANAILRTIEQLPTVNSWVVMVQREVGERLAATPGTRAYGIPSVLAQLACEVKILRPVSRAVFRPVPNVDSVLVGLHRWAAPPDPELRGLVQDAFAHRRKSLAASVAVARGFPELRQTARAALTELGHPADVRAERLSPADFRALAQSLQR
jgi:16S rRNA (adenine1518-N6/adenine1519-N6)-dimethyltransferase